MTESSFAEFDEEVCTGLPSNALSLRVAAQNAAGWGAHSDPITVVIGASGPPGAGPKGRVVRTTCDSVLLKWSPPKDTSTPVEEYEMSVQPEGDDEPFTIGELAKDELEVSGLDGDTTYSFLLKARNHFGWGSRGPAVQATTDASSHELPAPDAPFIVEPAA